MLTKISKISKFSLNKKQKFGMLKFLAPLISLPFLYYLTHNKKTFCLPEEDDENEFKSEDTKSNEFIDEEEDEMKALLEDPRVSEEEKKQYAQHISTQDVSPMPFKNMSGRVKASVDDEKWNGLRLNLDFNPNNMFKLDYVVVIDHNKKLLNNCKLSSMGQYPLDDKGKMGLMLMGRKDGEQGLVMQAHIMLSKNDRIALVSQYNKGDFKQVAYVGEYSHDFERFQTSFKLSNMEGLSASAVAPLFRNIFVGIEASKNPREPSLAYNYALCMNPSRDKPYGFYINYNNMPMFTLDAVYKFTKEFSIYFSAQKNWHPMAAQMGATEELKGVFIKFL